MPPLLCPLHWKWWAYWNVRDEPPWVSDEGGSMHNWSRFPLTGYSWQLEDTLRHVTLCQKRNCHVHKRDLSAALEWTTFRFQVSAGPITVKLCFFTTFENGASVRWKECAGGVDGVGNANNGVTIVAEVLHHRLWRWTTIGDGVEWPWMEVVVDCVARL